MQPRYIYTVYETARAISALPSLSLESARAWNRAWKSRAARYSRSKVTGSQSSSSRGSAVNRILELLFPANYGRTLNDLSQWITWCADKLIYESRSEIQLCAVGKGVEFARGANLEEGHIALFSSQPMKMIPAASRSADCVRRRTRLTGFNERLRNSSPRRVQHRDRLAPSSSSY